MRSSVSAAFLLGYLVLAGCQGQQGETHAQADPGSAPAASTQAAAPADAFATIALRKRQLPDAGITLGFPEFWEVQQRQEEAGRVWVSKMGCDDSVAFCANYVVNAVPLQDGASLDTYSNYYLTYLEKKYPVYKLVKVDRVTVDDMEGRVIDYIYQENNHNLGGTVALLKTEKAVVVLNFAALNEPAGDYVRYRGLYERVILSAMQL